jgi:hypothetical protein
VGGTRMIRLDEEDLLGDLGGSPLLGVGPVVRIGGGLQRERVEGRRFGVLRIAGGDCSMALSYADGARAVVETVGITIEGIGGRDVVALALRLAPIDLAFSIASVPRFRLAGLGGDQIWYQRLSAMPQYAMAQSGSAASRR